MTPMVRAWLTRDKKWQRSTARFERSALRPVEADLKWNAASGAACLRPRGPAKAQAPSTMAWAFEAQEAALARFAEAEGCAFAETFSEVETRKGADALDRRPHAANRLRLLAL